MEQKSEPFSWCLNEPAPVLRGYELLPSTEDEKKAICQSYQRAPVPDYDIAAIESLYNPNLYQRFFHHVILLQNRATAPAFLPHWSEEPFDSPEEQVWRRVIHKDWENATAPYHDAQYPAVRFVLSWHGTRKETINSLFKTGYAILKSTDQGFFGQGIYTTLEPAYAYQVYSDGTLIVNWVTTFSAFPVIHADVPKLYAKSNYQNYDTHWIPVVPGTNNPKEVNYIATCPHQPKVFTECVVFESSQCLPRYCVTLQPTGLHLATLRNHPEVSSTWATGAAYYAQGQSDEQNGEGQRALGHFVKAAEYGYPPAYWRVIDCAHAWGFHHQPEPYHIMAGDQFAWFYHHVTAVALMHPHHRHALYGLARCYEEGVGVEKNTEKAFRYYQQLVLQHNDDLLAHYHLGSCYERGIGGTLNLTQAVVHYRTSAEQGYAPAASRLAFCYENGLGTEKADDKAYVAYYQAAEKGHAGAQAKLAEFYEQGRFVQKDQERARQGYEKAAAQGQQTAQLTLAHWYQTGTGGVARDLIQAKFYARLAAEQGSALGQVLLEELTEKLAPQPNSLFYRCPVQLNTPTQTAHHKQESIRCRVQ